MQRAVADPLQAPQGIYSGNLFVATRVARNNGGLFGDGRVMFGGRPALLGGGRFFVDGQCAMRDDTRGTATLFTGTAQDICFLVSLNRGADYHALMAVTEWITTLVCKEYPPWLCKQRPPSVAPEAPCAVVSGIINQCMPRGKIDPTKFQMHQPRTGFVHDQILLICHRCRGSTPKDIIAHSFMNYDGMIREEHEESLGDLFLSSEHIASVLDKSTAPPCVFTVTVQGVSAKYAAASWRAIISPRLNWTREGLGHKMHAQWHYKDGPGYYSVGEKSSGFGWETEHSLLCAQDVRDTLEAMD